MVEKSGLICGFGDNAKGDLKEGKKIGFAGNSFFWCSKCGFTWITLTALTQLILIHGPPFLDHPKIANCLFGSPTLNSIFSCIFEVNSFMQLHHRHIRGE